MNGDNQHPRVARPIRKTSARSESDGVESRIAQSDDPPLPLLGGELAKLLILSWEGL